MSVEDERGKRRASSPRTEFASELPYLDKQLVQEPLALSPELPPMPPARQLHVPLDGHSSTTPSSQSTDLAAAESTFVNPQFSPALGATPTKASVVPKSGLPIRTRYNPPPSAFSRDPSLVPNVRDSVSTQQSATSSSLYPLSSSTASAPESPPSPRSLTEQLDHLEPLHFDAETDGGGPEFDSDDVAYRLQLLVKNNYFLPPAHSKPSPSDFAALAASSNQKKPNKSSAPAFLDLFRAVKPKSKPTTPTGSPHFDAPAPMLRATSDSLTDPHPARQQQPRTSSQIPRLPSRPASRGRVVVVREKMGDIAVAAKQAEQDLKNKGVRLDQIPPPVNQDVLDDVIDPTDAVDVPLPSASYPFAVQASALHGLGVQDSLGADILADRLPPPKSPNPSGNYELDVDWRKALLHQAVHHSLDNTPDASTFSHAVDLSTPIPSPRLRSKSAAPSPTALTGHLLFGGRNGGHFPELPVPTRSSHDRPRAKLPLTLNGLQRATALDTSGESRTSSWLPARMNTPCEPLTPLTPPPRRQLGTALFQSTSQTDLGTPENVPREQQRPLSNASHHTLRRAQSSPMLADCEPISRRAFAMTPPPPIPTSTAGSRIVSARTTMSFETVRDQFDAATTSESMYSDDFVYDDDDDAAARHSLTLSAVIGRPSLSAYSQDSLSSPTTSAFQEMLNRPTGYQSASSSSNPNPRSRSSTEQRTAYETHPGFPRESALSPPPRMSSSLAHVSALPPPPRRRFVRPVSIDSINSTEPASPTLDGDDTLQLNEPEPTTPPVPVSELRNSHGLSLDIPRHHVPPSIRSAPTSFSPPSFFDTIQAQHNAMDDLESSSDEDDDDVVDEMGRHPLPLPPLNRHLPDPSRPRTTSIASAPAPAPRSPLMKFGNHSTPYVSGGGEKSNIAGKTPVGNVAPKAPFFTERKADGDHSPPSSAYDFYRYAQSSLPPKATSLAAPSPSASRTSLGDTSQPGRPSFSGTMVSVNSQKAQESMKKLDGMLLQHMETEKDTIKRIATSMKQSSLSGHGEGGGDGGLSQMNQSKVSVNSIP
ncbi:hypothetical protein MD484_g3024, partial [Candolleomyces efflorescens]